MGLGGEAHLNEQGLCASMTKGYLAAVRHGQITFGLGDPQMPQLQYVLKGARRSTTGRADSTSYHARDPGMAPGGMGATPIQTSCGQHPPSASSRSSAWGRQSPRPIRVLTTGFTSPTDVPFNSATEPSWMEVTIKWWKCDKFCKGVTLSIEVPLHAPSRQCWATRFGEKSRDHYSSSKTDAS